MTAPISSGIPLPALLMGVMLLAAVGSYLLRSWLQVVAVVGAILAAGLAILVWQIDFTRPLWTLPGGMVIDLTAAVVRFDFTFQLQQANQPILSINLLIAACALLLMARPGQDDSAPALTWLLVSGYSLLALNSSAPKAPVIVGPIWLLMLTAISVFLLHGSRISRVSGPVRILIPPLLAAPLFLLSAWYIDQIPLNPQDVALARTAGVLMGLGLLVLLMPFPLHTAASTSAESAPPPATLLVFLLYQIAVLHLTAQVLSTFPFVLQQTEWPSWLSWLGIITAVWGGIAALGAVNAGRLWGYAALNDWGLIILVMAAPGVRSWALVVFLFSQRAISMFTAAAGLTTLEQHLGSLDIARLRGVGARLPWNSAAFLLGSLGLVGFPLTGGFASHWAALLTLAEFDWRPAAVALISAAIAVVGLLRVARLMYGALENRKIAREHTFSVVLAIAGLSVTLLVAVAPQALNDFIQRTLAAFG